jgi:hypothetical protein
MPSSREPQPDRPDRRECDPSDDNADVVIRPAALSDAELEGARKPGGGPRHAMEAPDGEPDIEREQKARP